MRPGFRGGDATGGDGELSAVALRFDSCRPETCARRVSRSAPCHRSTGTHRVLTILLRGCGSERAYAARRVFSEVTFRCEGSLNRRLRSACSKARDMYRHVTFLS